MIEKESQKIPANKRKSFAKEMKRLFKGGKTKIPISISFTALVDYGWREDDYAAYNPHPTDYGNFYEQEAVQIERFMKPIIKKYNDDINNFNLRFNALCKEHDADSYKVFNEIIDEFALQNVADAGH